VWKQWCSLSSMPILSVPGYYPNILITDNTQKCDDKIVNVTIGGKKGKGGST